jgi:predicted nucleotide-binding protein
LEKAKEKLELLIEEGKRFSYKNFATKSERGDPHEYSPEWIAWTTRVKNIINSVVDKNSAARALLESAIGTRLLGFGPDEFEVAQSYYLKALEETTATLDKDTFSELQRVGTAAPGKLSNDIFVVHGHDERAKAEIEIFLKEIGLTPIVLHRQPDEGQTILEKFEKHSNVGYALILLTPDEIAYLASEESKVDSERNKENRARPNVIFEFGYFVGKLGRSRVCCLYTGDVALPSDLGGLLYKQFKVSIKEVAYDIIKELKAVGYKVKLE